MRLPRDALQSDGPVKPAKGCCACTRKSERKWYVARGGNKFMAQQIEKRNEVTSETRSERVSHVAQLKADFPAQMSFPRIARTRVRFENLSALRRTSGAP